MLYSGNITKTAQHGAILRYLDVQYIQLLYIFKLPVYTLVIPYNGKLNLTFAQYMYQETKGKTESYQY